MNRLWPHSPTLLHKSIPSPWVSLLLPQIAVPGLYQPSTRGKLPVHLGWYKPKIQNLATRLHRLAQHQSYGSGTALRVVKKHLKSLAKAHSIDSLNFPFSKTSRRPLSSDQSMLPATMRLTVQPSENSMPSSSPTNVNVAPGQQDKNSGNENERYALPWLFNDDQFKADFNLGIQPIVWQN